MRSRPPWAHQLVASATHGLETATAPQDWVTRGGPDAMPSASARPATAPSQASQPIQAPQWAEAPCRRRFRRPVRRRIRRDVATPVSVGDRATPAGSAFERRVDAGPAAPSGRPPRHKGRLMLRRTESTSDAATAGGAPGGPPRPGLRGSSTPPPRPGWASWNKAPDHALPAHHPGHRLPVAGPDDGLPALSSTASGCRPQMSFLTVRQLSILSHRPSIP